MADWKTIPLQELIEPERGISYGIVQPGQHFQNGVPIIRVSDVRDGHISTREPLRVSPVIEAKYARTRLRGGELIIAPAATAYRYARDRASSRSFVESKWS